MNKDIRIEKYGGINSADVHMYINFKGISFVLSHVEEIAVSVNYKDCEQIEFDFSVFMKNGMFEFSVDNDANSIVESMIAEGFKVDFIDDQAIEERLKKRVCDVS